MGKYKNPRINDPDHLIGEHDIVLITENDEYASSTENIIEDLKSNKRRDWFSSHAYLCLPLVIGNQYGFIVKTLFDFYAEWNGGDNPGDTKIEVIDNQTEKQRELKGHQMINSHFGLGIITVQNRFHFRTAKGINLMTINPPNFFIDGIQHLTGVIETDNLRRDFTFNLKLTCPGKVVHVKAGTPVGCILPVERYFVDKFKIIDAKKIFELELIEEERNIGKEFGKEREIEDKDKKRGAGRRYFEGEDVRGIKFDDHQKRLD
tara:strand:+ start:43433 stop:44218 length:786 start_codon:yes stop_codon:yes gene_type:complete